MLCLVMVASLLIWIRQVGENDGMKSLNKTFVIGSQVEERQQPDCDTACCGGVMPGRWTRPDPAGDPGRRDYVPDAAQGCSYFPYRRAELLDKLLGEVGSVRRARV